MKSKEKLHVGVKWELGLGTGVVAWYNGRGRTGGWDSLQVQNYRGLGTGANLEADIFDLWTGTTTRRQFGSFGAAPCPQFGDSRLANQSTKLMSSSLLTKTTPFIISSTKSRLTHAFLDKFLPS